MNHFYQQRSFNLTDFVCLHGRSFIQAAYAGILKREPDQNGYDRYFEALQNGSMSKPEILGRLRYSSQGRQQHVAVRGLLLPFILSAAGRLPVIGYFIMLLMAIIRLPVLMRQFRVLENSSCSRIEQLESLVASHDQHLNRMVPELHRMAPELQHLTAAFDREIGPNFPEAVYLSLENEFRGNPADLEKKMEVYLPLIREASALGAPVLDLGCGRGEWLALLQKREIPAMGVDSSGIMVETCRAQGFEAVHTDALDFLRSLKDNSLPAITAMQLMEHLPPHILVRLWREIHRVLLPGGLVLFETPNPENVQVASYYFYLDPTHRKPIPPPLAAYTLDALGFKQVRIVRAREYDEPIFEDSRLNRFFCAPMDYAVVGIKPAEKVMPDGRGDEAPK
ncbi:MAG: methyltransferase domain-containing protein [Pseudomonadota bacterium]